MAEITDSGQTTEQAHQRACSKSEYHIETVHHIMRTLYLYSLRESGKSSLLRHPSASSLAHLIKANAGAFGPDATYLVDCRDPGRSRGPCGRFPLQFASYPLF